MAESFPVPQGHTFDDAATELAERQVPPATAQTVSPAYRLAYRDPDLLLRDGLRPLRFQLELLKPEALLDDAGIASTIVIYGSARITKPSPGAVPHPMACHYDEARKLAKLASSIEQPEDGKQHFVVCSGGGPSIMEAANRGAADAGRPSIGLNIVLPREQVPNAFVSPELCFQFHYFPLRKMHFILRARAVAVFPGGFGTLDELFDVLTLIQTGKMAVIPILLFDEPFWRELLNLDVLVRHGLIRDVDLTLVQFVESADDAWSQVRNFYERNPTPVWHAASSSQ